LNEASRPTSSTRAFRFLERFGVFTRSRGKILFLSRHEILDDIAADLADGLSADFEPDRKLLIFCGIHKVFGPDVLRPGFKIGIQTEHYYDETGAFIGRRKWEIAQVLRFVRRCAAILEMNPGNRPIYDRLSAKDKAKIVYGPHIFPVEAPSYKEPSNQRAAFFGTLSDRRRAVLGQLDPSKFSHLKSGKFGDELVTSLEGYAAVLNIHFDPGLYTEAPRLLLAFKSGKPVVSEQLSSEWRSGVHYLPIEEFDGKTHLKEVYSAMAQRCTEDFAFQDYLIGLGLSHDQSKAST
jgi:hypothetical protein